MTAVSLLSACTKDDVKDSKLVGTWEPSRSCGYEVNDGVREDWDGDVSAPADEGGYKRVSFLEDGTVRIYSYEDGVWQPDPVTGSWSLEDNVLSIDYTYKELVMERRGKYDDSNCYKETVTYTMVSE